MINHYILHMASIISEGLLGHDVVEILPRNLPPVRSRTLQHLLQLLDIHGLSQFLGHSADVVAVDAAGMVVVEQVENLVNAVLNKG